MSRTFADPFDLDSFHELLHDRWMDIDALTHDSRDLTVPFASRDIWRASRAIIDSTLTIHHVQRYELVDTEEVGLYNLNELTYEPGSGLIRITTGIPLELTAVVEQFEVTVVTPQL